MYIGSVHPGPVWYVILYIGVLRCVCLYCTVCVGSVHCAFALFSVHWFCTPWTGTLFCTTGCVSTVQCVSTVHCALALYSVHWFCTPWTGTLFCTSVFHCAVLYSVCWYCTVCVGTLQCIVLCSMLWYFAQCVGAVLCVLYGVHWFFGDDDWVVVGDVDDAIHYDCSNCTVSASGWLRVGLYGCGVVEMCCTCEHCEQHIYTCVYFYHIKQLVSQSVSQTQRCVAHANIAVTAHLHLRLFLPHQAVGQSVSQSNTEMCCTCEHCCHSISTLAFIFTTSSS